MQLITPTLLLALLGVVVSASGQSHPAAAPLEKRLPVVSLGLAAPYGALSATALTSTGATLVTGSCGTCPGTAITGFPPGVCSVSTSAGGTAACLAKAACGTAYTNALANPTTRRLSTSSLGNLVLPPGVYEPSTVSASLQGTLTLNGTGNANGQFIFKIATTFTTLAAAKIVLVGGAQACNVFFAVGSSASVGAASVLQGNVVAYTSISVGSGAANRGTWCALNGAVTLINNKLTALTSCTSS
ncbi:hypothetical protein LZ554_009220 [Drepanopeziza brunnea f. sp. 'monogermtubi']|nr:hypothetical protein LZ554_009220 [Drepanopeziza brunnea f. sp. 'monogermtubi']